MLLLPVFWNIYEYYPALTKHSRGHPDKKTTETITDILMGLMVVMGIALVLMMRCYLVDGNIIKSYWNRFK